MSPITVQGFNGASYSIDDTLLPDTVGVASLNQRPGYNDMRPWNQPGSTLATIPSSPQRKTIWRMGQDVASEANYWLSWTDVVHAARGFDVDDTSERTYFTGWDTPKWTDNVKALTGGAPYPQATRELGVPAPTGALTAAINVDGTGTEEAVAFCYTFVNELGWESAPSPSSNVVLAKPGATIDLTGFSSAPAGNFGITTVRLYKLVGSAAWLYHRQWAIGATPSNPIDDARALGSAVLSTEGWRPCPGIAGGGSLNLTEPTASGLRRLWNGMHAVISGKSVRFCVPNAPYAWPVAYEVRTTDTPVALGVWGQQVLVLTTGDAEVIVGSSPDSMDGEPTRTNRPCSSVQSVVDFNEGERVRGVMWASEECLCWFGDDGFRDLSSAFMDPDAWRAMVPSSMVAARYRGIYVCFYNDGSGLKGFTIDPKDPRGIYPLSVGYNAVFRDPLQDRLYVLDGANIKRWDAGAAMTAEFTSKTFTLPYPINIGAIEVIAKGWPVTVTMWGDGTQRLSQTLNSDLVIRPPGGWQADNLKLKLSSASRVVALRAARSVDDLTSSV